MDRIQTNVIRLGLVLVILIGVFYTGVADDVAQRLHPALRPLLYATENAPNAPFSTLDDSQYSIEWSPSAGEQRIDLLIGLRQPITDSTLQGLSLGASSGTVVSVEATANDLKRLLADERVDYIEPAWRATPMLDESVDTVRADTLHQQSPAQTGRGVIIGAVDTGIDYTHLDFREDVDGDGFEESSRILAIWDQTAGFSGTEYTKEEIETDLANGHGSSAGIVRQKDTNGHGTHVMSIAAGDGSSSGAGFVGVAPNAWIVMVKTTYFTSDILEAVEYIFDLADSLGLPAVVNLSLGGHDGPHDGTSLFEQGLDELLDEPGRAIVVSAGNEGDLALHASANLRGGSDSFTIEPDGWETELAIWYPGTAAFTLAITPPGEAPIIVPFGTETGVVTTLAGNLRVDNASGGANPRNGDHHAYLRLSNLASTASWGITVSDTGGGDGGIFDAWVTDGGATLGGGDSSSTIDEPGNARSVITVGSFNTKAVWPSMSGQQNFLGTYPLQVLSTFSSQGPTRDGRTKPEICAPGAWICAALSTDAIWQGYLLHPDTVHTMELGTSMAAPHVSGAAALLFAVDPGLTADEVKTALVQSAIQDGFTGSVPNLRWGFGKLDVAAAVGAIDAPEPPPVDPPSSGDAPTISLDENPVGDHATFLLGIPEDANMAELRVYTLSGALVYSAHVDVETVQTDWGLSTLRGEPLASGLYLYVLVTDVGTSEPGKLVIAR